MAIYKFKITFEEYEEVYRVIEVKSTQTFLDLHKAILDSIGFDQKQLGSFYMSDDSWKKGQEITLEDMSDYDDENLASLIPTMANSKLSEFIIDPHQKILYVYDFLDVWVFNIELTGIDVKEKAGQQYPFCSKSIGIAPKQYDKNKTAIIDDNEFDEITKNYLYKEDDGSDGLSDEEADEFGLFNDEQSEAGGEDF